MQSSNLKINYQSYFWYKFFNSIFNGLTVGAIFTMYAPLEPSIFSIGGIVLAIGLIVIAKFYDKLIQIDKFFKISILVELVMLFTVIIFLLNPFNYMIVLAIYLGYQFTFMFGSYLVRAETLFIKRKNLLSKLDIFKQSGYLVGLGLSWVFYKVLELGLSIEVNDDKVYYMHFLLLIIEVVILVTLNKAFKRV